MTELKSKRIQMGMSQEKLATLLGVSINAYRRWEVGVNKPNDINRQVIKDVLELEV